MVNLKEPTYLKYPNKDGYPKMDEFVISIHIKETLSEDWSAWLNGVMITLDEEGNTHLSGCVPDQAAVRGLLVKLWDLNLTVISFSYKVSNQLMRKPNDR